MAQDSVELTQGSGTKIATKALDSGEEVQQIAIVRTGDGSAKEIEAAEDATLDRIAGLLRTLIAEQRVTNLILANGFGVSGDLERLRAETLGATDKETQ